jgi:geranylgeranyl pyrophosphate synthase
MSVRAPISGPEQLAAVLDAADGDVRGLVARAERRLADVAGVERHAGETLSAGGKRLRPILVFLCAGAARSEQLVHAGVAVELLHMATLVHDDVLDRATLRRGRPTVYAAGGPDAATATGDLLFSRAFAELSLTGSREAVAALSAASSALARGELIQRQDAWSDAVTPARYLERCELKTARLFEAACRLGAMLGEPGSDAADLLGTFGSRVGIAFQIFDDVLDVSGPTARTGKPRGTDLLDGTVTLPLILARRRDPELQGLDLHASVTNAAEAEALCDRIQATGALPKARDRALAFVSEAKAALRELDLPHRQRLALELVADGVVERYA